MLSFKQTGFIFLVVAISATASAQNDLPADKKATTQTVHLYQYLKKSPVKGFMFGHQDDLAYGVGWKYIPGKIILQYTAGNWDVLRSIIQTTWMECLLTR